METQADNQAMTEVALGLAMAFFALMVLAMVSMSVSTDVAAKNTVAVAVEDEQSESKSSGVTEIQRKDMFVIFHNGRYFSDQLAPLNPQQLPPAERYILALSPSLSFDQVMAARNGVFAPNLIITQLNEHWLQRLASE